jgi:thiamine biosynthesis lipoprotein
MNFHPTPVFPALLFTLCLTSCAQPLPVQTEFVLGTVCTVNLYERGTDKVYREIFTRLREIEDRMSANKEGTEVDKVNRNAGLAPVTVHPDVLEVTKSALHYAELSRGAFDPTIGALVKLWNIGSDDARVPSAQEISAMLPLVAYRDLVIDEKAGTLFLKRPGMRLDLGAIAKGYAADEVARIIKSHRIPRAMVDLGGNILAYGSKSGGAPWRIGVQDPVSERGNHIGILETINKTLVTSGVYERYLEAEGKHWHHILDTKTGYPVENGLVSVTIVADHSIDADGLSTSVFALGYEAGLALVESLPGIDAIFINRELEIRVSKGLKDKFRVTDDRFRLIESD